MATQSVRIGWRPYVNVVTQVVNAVDADAQAFISAAGITNLTQAAAINTLVNDLKTYGLWTKMKAIYPFVGGSATSHKFNLKDPRDLDAAYRLVFNGGWVHSLNGATPNGTTGYADTKFIPSTNLGAYSVHLSYYSRTNRGFRNSIAIGAWQDSPTHNNIDLRLNGDNAVGSGYSVSAMFDGWNGLDYASYATTRSDYFLIGSKTAINLNKVYENGVLKGTNTATSARAMPNVRVLIGAESRGTTGATNYDNLESAFASIGDGLTDTDATNFYTSVQKFNTTLGRHVGSPIVSDSDAQAFINAAGITDFGQATAVNTLVTDLKAAGIWTKMKTIYPFVGGTATSHKFNLKDPRDLDVAFRLTFTGGWTHTSTGALPNGSNGYANTFFVPSNNFPISQYDAHISLYSRTNVEAPTTNWLSGTIGVDDDYNSGAYFVLNVNSKTSRIVQGRTLGNQWATYSGPLDDSRGLFMINKQSNTSLKLTKNSTLLASNTTLSTALSRPAQRFYIGAVNGSQSYSGLNYDNKEYAFITIGDGLTDTESSAFYAAVQKYQTSLGRQIGTPVLPSGQTAGLLETYPSTTAAYSLRKLRAGYYGFAIRVRRSSDNTEQDISFKADGTLDTTYLLAFVGNGDGFVTTWYDQSGNGYNFTQTTAANQPQIVSTGSITTKNSKPTIKFDGLNDYMTILNSQSTFSFLHKIGQSFVSFVGYGVSSTEYVLLENNWGSTAHIGYSLWTTANNNITNFITKGIGGSPVSSNTNASNTIVPNTLFMVNTEADPGNATASLRSKLYFNNSSVVTNNVYTNAASTSNATYNLNLGAAVGGSPYSFLNGGVSELIIYNSDQSANRTGISTNINSYYSIY